MANPPLATWHNNRSLGRPDRVPTTDREALVYGVDDPATPGNSGLLTNSNDLTVVSGTFTPPAGTAEAYTVISDKVFLGRVALTSYVKFKDCWFSGFAGQTGANAYLLHGPGASAHHNIFEDCLFACPAPLYSTNGGHIHDAEFRRCEFKWLTDGIQHFNTSDWSTMNLKFYGCHFHDMAILSPDPAAAGGVYDNQSHLDGIQLQGGYNLEVVGCRFNMLCSTDSLGGINQGRVRSVDRLELDGEGQWTGKLLHDSGNKYWTYKRDPITGAFLTPLQELTPVPQAFNGTSCFMFSPTLSNMGNVKINQNWMNGASALVNFGTKFQGTYTLDGIEMVGNRFGQDMRVGPTYATIGWGGSSIINKIHHDNVWFDGTPADGNGFH